MRCKATESLTVKQQQNTFVCTLFTKLCQGCAKALWFVFNTPKNPYLNQATQKNTCQIFLPKKIPESKISNPKKSFDHPHHFKSGVPPPSPGQFCYALMTIPL